MDTNQTPPFTNESGLGVGIYGQSNDWAEDGEFSDTVGRLQNIVKPVEPSPVFREELRLRLARAALWNQSSVQLAASDDRARGMLIGAALLSVAGALVYLWRARDPHTAGRGSTVLLKSRPTTHDMPLTTA
ncbi:MAG: hypothetical protein Q7O66_02840 [Dehalococcoidia bacterium]|nr:hypothetical protein [Dehalococcoidia bacterium]